MTEKLKDVSAPTGDSAGEPAGESRGSSLLQAARKRRKLTLPLFSLVHDPEMRIKVTGKFRRASMPGLAKNDDGMVTILPCVNMDTGEEGLLLAYTVVESAITRSTDDYVGRCYEIVRGGKAAGKNYYEVDVYEIDE